MKCKVAHTGVNKNMTQFTPQALDELIERVAAGSSRPPEYNFYATQHLVDSAPEYFYRDEHGVLWFDHPFLCRAKTIILPPAVFEPGSELYVVNKTELDKVIQEENVEYSIP